MKDNIKAISSTFSWWKKMLLIFNLVIIGVSLVIISSIVLYFIFFIISTILIIIYLNIYEVYRKDDFIIVKKPFHSEQSFNKSEITKVESIFFRYCIIKTKKNQYIFAQKYSAFFKKNLLGIPIKDIYNF